MNKLKSLIIASAILGSGLLIARKINPDLFGALGSSNWKTDSQKKELILLFTNEKDKFQISGDSLALSDEYERIGRIPTLIKIGSYEELKQFLISCSEKYDGLALCGHGSPYEINIDESVTKFGIRKDSLCQIGFSRDLTSTSVIADLALYKSFSAKCLSPDSRILFIICNAGSYVINHKGGVIKCYPIAKAIANALGRTGIAPIGKIGISGFTPAGDTLYYTMGKDILTKEGEVSFAGMITYMKKNGDMIISPLLSNKYPNFFVLDPNNYIKISLEKVSSLTPDPTEISETSSDDFNVFSPIKKD